jgi:hypothetical protein
MTPEEFFNTEEYSIDVTISKGKHYIAYNDVKKLMTQYHEKLKQLELTAVVQAKPEVCVCKQKDAHEDENGVYCWNCDLPIKAN